MIAIKKYLNLALLGLFLFLGLGFKHFKDKSEKLDKDLEAEKQKNTKQESQVKTYLKQQEISKKEVQRAKDHSFIKRDYFE